MDIIYIDRQEHQITYGISILPGDITNLRKLNECKLDLCLYNWYSIPKSLYELINIVRLEIYNKDVSLFEDNFIGISKLVNLKELNISLGNSFNEDFFQKICKLKNLVLRINFGKLPKSFFLLKI